MVSELLRGLEDKFFQKLGEVDRGRLKVPKLKSKTGWVLSCDLWPSSGGHSNIKVCLGDNKQGWRSSLNMLDNFCSREEYVKWFSRNQLKHILTIMETKLSYAHKVKQKKCIVFVTKKASRDCRSPVALADTKVAKISPCPSSCLNIDKQKQ